MNVTTTSFTPPTTTPPITTSPTTPSPSQPVPGVNWGQAAIKTPYSRIESQLNETVEKLTDLAAKFEGLSEGLPIELDELEHLQKAPDTDANITEKGINLTSQLKEKFAQLERCTQEIQNLKKQIDHLMKEREMITLKDSILNIR